MKKLNMQITNNLILHCSPYNQSLVQINASIISSLSELLYESITRPPVLKVDSEAIVEIGILKISWVMTATSG